MKPRKGAKAKKRVRKSFRGGPETKKGVVPATVRAEVVDVVADVEERPPLPVTVVGVGASAGGLEAFTQILEALGQDPGVAIVFVQHLAPQHESALSALLSGRTHLPVVQVTEGMQVEPNRVYVIPPNAQMEIRGDELHLNPRPADRTQYTPIDFFFRSLADMAGSQAIGVILSGSSSDGAAGLREIKAVGGITIAQDPETAKYDVMPRAAIATETVDLALSPTDIAKEILRLGQDPYVRPERQRPHEQQFTVNDDDFHRVLALVRSASGIDFTHYKAPTINRRLQRRMVLQKMRDVSQYLRFLQMNPEEAQKLAHDILIQVTRFFREPESFAALGTIVLPQMLEKRSGDDAVRIWVPGCATGEEAYSVAMALLEHLGDGANRIPIQIFATDVSEAAIEHARGGLFPQTIGADVSAERLRRFFNKTDGSYRVTKVVRDLCVFARQDLTRDPPFSKLDLIVCRNVLIYLGMPLQRKLLSVFHYALKPTGFLMLGHAETVAPYGELFVVAHKKFRIYLKKPNAMVSTRDLAGEFSMAASAQVGGRKAVETRPSVVMQNEAQRLLLDLYAPPGVIVDEELRIVQFIGHTGRFIEPAPGDANLLLPSMIRDNLLYALRAAFHEARRQGKPASRANLHVRPGGDEREVTLQVIPLGPREAKEHHYLVVFQDVRATSKEVPARRRRGSRSAVPRSIKDARISKLEQELSASRDYLQSIIQELEAANEELQSANEEILSSNEELQSTNEELDTAKEELQSTNEELNTVNEELHGRNEELSRVNSDLMNLLGSVQVALVMIENDLRIHRFTPMAERVLNLIPSDIGRPIGHIKPNIDCPELEGLIHEVIETVTPREREVQDLQGHWFLLQIRPYKSVENRIDGAVLALFDIDSTKRHEGELQAAHDYAQAIVETVRESLVVVDRELRVRSVNKAFCEKFHVAATDVVGRSFQEVGKGQWDSATLRAYLGDVVAKGVAMESLSVDWELPAIGRRKMVVNARRIEKADGSPELILLAIHDAADGLANA